MESLHHPVVAELARGADHLDEKAFRGPAGQSDFVRGILFAPPPGWLRALLALRGVLAKILGLRHETTATEAQAPRAMPTDIGQGLGMWTVRAFEPGRLWAAGIADKHLNVVLSVLSQPTGQGLFEHRVLTIVHYNHWTGPLYFNLIRPFHHLVVWRCGRRAAAGLGA